MTKEFIGELELNRIYQRDCLEGMRMLPDKSIDMILCDLPYGNGKTKCRWDFIIPFEALWEQYLRVIKDNGAIVLFSSQPFTTDLINSNRKMFKQELIWDKDYTTDFQLANKRPMRSHENILVFYKKQPTYNPQKEKREKPLDKRNWNERTNRGSEVMPFASKSVDKKILTDKFPRSIIKFNAVAGECNNTKRIHPSQKPVVMFEWLIKTYTNESETVLDNCMGSGTTAVAAVHTNRKFIGFELESEYVEIANKRLDNEMQI